MNSYIYLFFFVFSLNVFSNGHRDFEVEMHLSISPLEFGEVFCVGEMDTSSFSTAANKGPSLRIQKMKKNPSMYEVHYSGNGFYGISEIVIENLSCLFDPDNSFLVSCSNIDGDIVYTKIQHSIKIGVMDPIARKFVRTEVKSLRVYTYSEKLPTEIKDSIKENGEKAFFPFNVFGDQCQ